MLTMLDKWQGQIEINGQEVKATDLSNFKPGNGPIHIKLYPKNVAHREEAENKEISNVITEPEHKTEYRITVKKYMTQKSSPQFDFMEKWNNNNPMPLRTMVGTIDKETRGMIYMTLHGDIYAEKICTCMKCGKTLTNPVSQYFGIGPECGGHNYVNPFSSEQELKQTVEAYRKKLQNMTWSGWVIRSAITEQVEV